MTLGTPQDVTLQELRIESFFPADLARLRQQELAAIVQLYRALGGGWSLQP